MYILCSGIKQASVFGDVDKEMKAEAVDCEKRGWLLGVVLDLLTMITFVRCLFEYHTY